MGKRKEHHEEHPDERWLVTYADVLTLMYVLFMVLFSISVVNTSKFQVLKQSLEGAFSGGVPEGGNGVLVGQTVMDQPEIVEGIPQIIAPQVPKTARVDMTNASPAQALETSQLEEVEEKVDKAVEAAGLGGKVETAVNERGLAIRVLTDDLLFASGSAVLQPTANRVLGPVVAGVRGLSNPVRVEGHTDSDPIATGQFPSNWYLSAARSAAVVQFMVSDGLPSARVFGTLHADTRPVASNATFAGKAKNRRVEILVLRTQGAPGSTAATVLGG